MRQLTLIALYGCKNDTLSSVISSCQKKIAEVLGESFHAYKNQQVHATIADLQQISVSHNYNLNFLKYRGQRKPMDFEGLLQFLRTGGFSPFQVQLGGFQNRDYPFTSLGLRPFERSFSIQHDKAVLIGWPIRGKPLSTL